MLRTISQLHPRSTSLLRSPPRTISTYLATTSSPASITNPKIPTLIPQNSPPFPQFSTLSFPFSSTRIVERRHNDNNYDDNDSVTEPPKLFVVQPRHRSESVLQTKLQEALNLANSLEEQRDGYYDTEFSEKKMPAHVVVQNPMSRSPRADTYFGHGTVDTVKIHINALESKDTVDAIFVNATLTSIQQRNLERKWGKPVLDRVGLIIEIFNAHAQTKEAKLQAELAALMYKRSRLVRVLGPDGRSTFGTGGMEVVSARGRGGGGQGFMSGAGETELQLQRRRIVERRTQLLSEIKEVRRTRALQRASRRRHDSNGEGIPTVAVVGYTNAGKSTLVSSLSDTYLFCDDRLFATVDPKLRSVILPSGRKVLLSDTVGFISDLPVQLVEAFHATLEEVVEADLLVHVLDSSSPNLDEQREAVLLVLEQIGVSKEKLQNMIEVWNKIDLEDQEFDIDEYDDEDVDCLSDGEDDDDDDDDNASDQLPCSDSEVCELDDNNNDNEKSDMLAKLEDDPDDWLEMGGELESWVNYEDSSLGQEIPEGGTTRQEPTSMTWKYEGKDSRSESGFTPHVKTSAVTGTGLHELLELIDERLKNQNGNVVERNMIDRKWRPPRSEDDSTVAAAI